MLSPWRTSHRCAYVLMKPSPFQERLFRCPFRICLKETFFWISFFISFLPPTSQKARSKEYWPLQERGWGVFLLSPLPLDSAVFPRVPPRERMEGGYQGPNRGSTGPGSKETSGYKQYRTAEVLIPPEQKGGKTHYNCHPLTSSSQYLFLLMPPALCCQMKYAHFIDWLSSLLQSRE